MIIWEISDDEISIEIATKNETDFDKPPNFTGSSYLDNWTPFQVITLKKGTKGDFTQLLKGVPVFPKKTLDVMDSLVQRDVEYLPLIHEELELYIINVIKVIDCVDMDKSIVNKFDSGKLMSFKKICLLGERLKDVPNIFKIPDKSTHVFVTDAFKNRVLEAKLKGFVFKEIWNSEATDEMEEEHRRRYNGMLEAIENTEGPRFSYGNAVRMIEAGKAVAHKQWKLQADKNGSMLIGTFGEDCIYKWIDPMYIPPIFLEIEWYEVEKSEI